VIDDGGRRAVARWERPAHPGALARLREASDIVPRLRRSETRWTPLSQPGQVLDMAAADVSDMCATEMPPR
jgi:hypothetical protein